MAKEKLLYPPKVFSYNECKEGKIVDYDVYQQYMKDKKVGDHTIAYAGAPGTGFIEHKITRMDETGIYGIVVRNTIRELSPEEVI